MCLSGISNVGVAKSGDGLPLCSPYSLDVSPLRFEGGCTGVPKIEAAAYHRLQINN
jgi:hypothetical protein